MELKYIIEDTTIIRLLGQNNFTNKESAMLEIVKNAYDAGATELDIYISNNQIIFKDNGQGMTAQNIEEKWMHIGISDKSYEFFDENNKKRVFAGSKGIGRFALSRLGSEVFLISKKKVDLLFVGESEEYIEWQTDWNTNKLFKLKKNELSPSNFLENFFEKNSGTFIIINDLTDRWTEAGFQKLCKYLSQAYNNDFMKINISYNKNIPQIIEPYFKIETQRIEHKNTSTWDKYLTKIHFKYDNTKQSLICDIRSDEFDLERANMYIKSPNHFSEYTEIINVYNDLKGNESNIQFDYDIENYDQEVKNLLTSIGSFEGEYYFSNTVAAVDIEKFYYKKRPYFVRYESGIILYRNDFSISSLEGNTDWLRLGARARRSPAAATHPTGSWRVKENQLSGWILIDKQNNAILNDLSNRQGLEQGDAYPLFTYINTLAISIFERYRQNIIRTIINSSPKDVVPAKQFTAEKVAQYVLKHPDNLKTLSLEEANQLVTVIKEYKKESKSFKKELVSTEKRYKYDVRILNILATVGLKASSIAHEMRNDRNNLSNITQYIIDALIEYNLWDIVNKEENRKFIDMDIPTLLEKNNQVNNKIVSFMDTMLTEIQRDKFTTKSQNVYRLVAEIIGIWKREYTWITFKINIVEDMVFNLSEDVFRTIFDNMILNSIQQNNKNNHLSIFIQIHMENHNLDCEYSDNGIGLAEKYRNFPNRILEVHETSRNNGHGLGMWIVNNTIQMTGGEIKNIQGIDGFKINFKIGGKL